MGTVIFIIVFVILAVAAAVFGSRIGKGMRQGVGIGLMLLGLGQVIDPPQRHGTESVENDRDDSEAGNGEKR